MDFNEHVGYDIVGFCGKEFVIELDLKNHHLNRYGIVHGGVLFTMLDTAMSRAYLDTFLPDANKGVTLEANIHYLKAAHSGKLVAFGVLVNTTRRTAFVEGRIEDDAGNLVAKASSTMMRAELG